MLKSAWLAAGFLACGLVWGSSAQASEPPARTMTISGSATVKTAPDQVVINFAIETRRSLPASARRDFVVGTAEALKTSAPLLGECQAAGEETSKRLREALKALGVEERQVRTESFQVEPQTWVDDGVLYFRGYLCRHVMSVTLKDPAKADPCLDTVLKHGATHVYGVSFDTTQLRKFRDEARKLACKAAREKADLLAGELGAKVKRVLTINEGGFNSWCGKNWGYGQQSYAQQNVYRQSEFAPQERDGGEAGELTAGEVAVQASVSVVFELE